MVKTDTDKYPASNFISSQPTMTQKEYVKVVQKKSDKGKDKLKERGEASKKAEEPKRIKAKIQTKLNYRRVRM